MLLGHSSKKSASTSTMRNSCVACTPTPLSHHQGAEQRAVDQYDPGFDVLGEVRCVWCEPARGDEHPSGCACCVEGTEEGLDLWSAHGGLRLVALGLDVDPL